MNPIFSDLLNRLFKREATIHAIAVLALTPAIINTPAAAQEAPVFINQETGEQVDLIRPYWNANVDIANRRMQCDNFRFNRESAVYEKNGSTEFFHNPLSEGRGGGSVDNSMPGYYADISWRVTDGLYRGIAPLGQDQFIELVTYNASSSATQNNAVREWEWSTSQNTGTSYTVCFDLDGAPLRPTGSAEIGNTDLLPEQTFSFQLPRSGTPVTETPEIVRLDTGESVKFVRAEFDYSEDLAGRGLNCWHQEWIEEDGVYRRAYKPEGASTVYSFPYAYTGGNTVLAKSAPDDFEQETYPFAIADFMSGTVSTSFIEVDDFGYNMWGSSPFTFYRCDVWATSEEPFAPNRILLTPQESCDYRTADQYDGWGWNAATQEGCPPENITDNATTVESADAQFIPVISVPTAQSDINVSVDNFADNETISVDAAGDVQPNPGPSDNIPNNSIDDSGAAGTATNDADTTDETEEIISNTQDESSGTDLVLSDQSTSQSGGNGGGSFWLPLLIFALVLRRPLSVIQSRVDS